jgi:uncharacterized protein (TIGR02271 family)
MRQTVVGVFDKYSAAQRAAQQLRDSGFGDSVFVTEEVQEASPDVSSRPREGEGGAFESVRRFFADLFGNDDSREVTTYAEAVRRGGAVVKVEVDEQETDAARSALEAAGALDIDEQARQWQSAGWTAGEAGAPVSGTMEAPAGTATASAGTLGTGTRGDSSITGTEGKEVIPVVQEELQVGKRAVKTGAVRVYARAIERPVEESVTLRSEHAEVERRPVDRAASEADLQAFKDRTIEVSETDEQAVVAKTARVVEEVVVGKTASERTERVSDTVRETRVEVEGTPGSVSAGTTGREDEFRRDFLTRYGSTGERYEDYEPAYLYGHTLSSDERYRGRSWDEAEPEFQRDWEARYPGSSWERFKAAVRRGWERMTS